VKAVLPSPPSPSPPSPRGRPRSGVELPWLLSGAWAFQGEHPDGDAPEGYEAEAEAGSRRYRRTVRDWVVDVLFFVAALVTVIAGVLLSSGSAWAVHDGVVSVPAAWYELPLCGLGCLALWWRRRWPVGVALVCVPLGVLVMPTPTHPAALAVFTVAVYRPARTALLVAAPVLVTAPLYFVMHPDTGLNPATENVLFTFAGTVAVLGWGMLVRSRRQVLASMAERAQRAEAEQRLRVERGRRAERARIAREMHHVLAHRIAQVDRQAQALQYRADAAAGEMSRAAGVIRTAAHQGLEELRDVIGLLRDWPEGAAPQPRDRPEPVGRTADGAVPDLPSDEEGPKRGTGRVRWRVRELIVDGALFVVSAALVGLYLMAPGDHWTSQPVRLGDLTFGALACLALWWRRHRPVAVAWVCVPLGVFVFSTGLVAALIALFTVAARRPPRNALLLGAGAVAAAPLFFLVTTQEPGAPDLNTIPAGIMFVAAALGWGMLTRSRQQLIGVLRERAERARRAQHQRAEEARRGERTRIAREVHDVLAHRISLVSLHAGALEHRPDTAPDKITQAVEVIRTNAAQALQELQEVVGLLHDDPGADHDPDPGRPERPQPCLADVPELLAHSTAAGNRTHYTTTVTDPHTVPISAGRTVYRLVQEALTNARKHAPGNDVHLTVTAVPDWLHVEVVNPLPTPETPRQTGDLMPGSGTGLIGLGERITLAHGHLTYGPTPHATFRLEAWIPCPSCPA
jgi:signal transduction histidine kinase